MQLSFFAVAATALSPATAPLSRRGLVAAGGKAAAAAVLMPFAASAMDGYVPPTARIGFRP